MPEVSRKCPSCGGELEEGVLLDRNHMDRFRFAQWLQGPPESGWFGLKTDGRRLSVNGWRCAKCGLLQLFANWPER